MPRWWRSPLVHFVFLGGVLFALERIASGPPARTPEPLVIDAARVRQVRDDYQRATALAPTAADERTLVARAVDEELLYQEALARGLDRDDRSIRWQLIEKMSFLDGADEYGGDRDALLKRALDLGLDRDDTVIRRMLVEKVRLLVKEAVAREPVSDAEVRVYLAGHRDAYRQPGRVTFRHVFLSSARRGAKLEGDARGLLAALRAGTLSPDEAAACGDAFPLPAELRGQAPVAIAAAFGEPFAADVVHAPLGAWTGPIVSAYGLHLVRVETVDPGDVAPLASVRERLLLAIRRERARARFDELLTRLRGSREVRVEWPEGRGS